MTWKIAWRNLWRHRGRTLIMGSAVAITYALMLFMMGVNDDSHSRMLREAARVAGGDVLVHGAGYWESRAGDVVIPRGQAVVAALDDVAGVRAVIPRVLVNGLVSTSADSRPVMLQGIEPERERALNDYADDVVAGAFLDGGEDTPLVLGRRLGERLEAEIGDRVVLTATDPGGEMVRALFRLTGIVETGTRDLDEVVGFTTIPAAQRAVGMPGMLTQVGLLAEQGVDAEVLRHGAAAALPDVGPLEVLTWAEAAPEMVGLLQFDETFGYILMTIILAVVLFSITNTFLMAVMERVREFGLLNALGLHPRRIGALMLAETTLMVGLAMLAGLVLGLAGHLVVARYGISMAGFGLEDVDMAGIDVSDMVIYSTLNPLRWAVGSLLVAGATLASALYPAWKATRLAPAEAMRFYE